MKSLLSIILIALLFIGCTTRKENAKLKAELEALAGENAMLAAGDVEMELTIAEYQLMLQEIDENIAVIDDKNNTVKALTSGNEQDVEDDILLHLEHVHGTLTNTKHKVAHLQNNLDKLYKDKEMEDEVVLALEIELDEAAGAIIERDVVIDALNDEVAKEGIEIGMLAVAYEQQAELSEALYGTLNTAFVVIATKKDLKKYGIIDANGGFLGMGRVKSLAADANDEWFIQVPKDATDQITLEYKKVKLLTTHPESSYSLTGDEVVESLEILDRMAFWGKSDFLVIDIVRE